MKIKAASLVIVLSLTVVSCGMKVKVDLVAGAEGQNGNVVGSTTGTGSDAGTTTGGEAAATTGAGGVTTGTAGTGAAGTAGVVSSALFPNETEGVTKDTITLCAHVPITGAAPIPHHKNRFGQFYFDHVNASGGIHGRKVRFIVFDDGYYPAGARAAMEKCAKEGAFMYLGSAGTDQIVSVAKWAEKKQVPYFHGPTSDKDMVGFRYNIHAGPTYEYQHRLLAKLMVKKFGTDVDYGMIRVNSPYFEAGHNAYVDELKKLGVALVVDRVVQKDQNTFNEVLRDLTTKGTKGSAGVEIVNNFTTPNIWLKMLRQENYPQYTPTWTAVSPVAGFNIVAQALSGTGGNAIVFQHFVPACNCTDYQTDLDESLPYAGDIKQFLSIFKKYSPEQNPRPDDFDYTSYLAARGVERILRALGPNPTRTGLFKLLKTYKEPAKVAFPACGADFTREERRGSWFVNVFELKVGKWTQSASDTCVDNV